MSAELLSLSKSITPCPIFFKEPCKYVFILVAYFIVYYFSFPLEHKLNKSRNLVSFCDCCIPTIQHSS